MTINEDIYQTWWFFGWLIQYVVQNIQYSPYYMGHVTHVNHVNHIILSLNIIKVKFEWRLPLITCFLLQTFCGFTNINDVIIWVDFTYIIHRLNVRHILNSAFYLLYLLKDLKDSESESQTWLELVIFLFIERVLDAESKDILIKWIFTHEKPD